MPVYLGKKQQKNKETQSVIKVEKLQVSQEEYMKQLKLINENFQKNLHQFAGKYKEEINRDPDFRDKFNELCDKMDVNPMLCKYMHLCDQLIARKSIWTDLGFGDFYNELAIKILDVCNRKKSFNGGIMKLQDVIVDFRQIYKMKITKKDIERSLKTINTLGGCSINKDYICTMPIELSEDFSILIDVAELSGYINASIMKKQKQWESDRFNQKIIVLQREGLVWVDKKTNTDEYNYYFPSMINNQYNQ